jgi:hypothetical protein
VSPAVEAIRPCSANHRGRPYQRCRLQLTPPLTRPTAAPPATSRKAGPEGSAASLGGWPGLGRCLDDSVKQPAVDSGRDNRPCHKCKGAIGVETIRGNESPGQGEDNGWQRVPFLYPRCQDPSGRQAYQGCIDHQTENHQLLGSYGHRISLPLPNTQFQQPAHASTAL